MKKNIWKQRFEQINDFERYLVRNGIAVLKFFLNVSREEQRRVSSRAWTLRKRIGSFLWPTPRNGPLGRLSRAFEAVFNHTSTRWRPGM